MVGQVSPLTHDSHTQNIFYKIFFNPVHGDISHDMGTPLPQNICYKYFFIHAYKKNIYKNFSHGGWHDPDP